MKNQAAIRGRYLRDGPPTRLGGLAANLLRIKSFADRNGSHEVVVSLIEESKLLIEWTAGEFEADRAAQLVALQVELAGWQLRWPQVCGDPEARSRVAQRAANWSDRVMEMSGLLR
jgi:broad specificity phosphatase PhoE